MKPKLRRLLWMLAWGAAIYFVVQGGEFGTTDIVTQSLEKRRLTAAIESMKVEVDSLKKYEKAVKTDPKTQERIAREQWGMVRVNEILYLFDTIPETGRPP